MHTLARRCARLAGSVMINGLNISVLYLTPSSLAGSVMTNRLNINKNVKTGCSKRVPRFSIIVEYQRFMPHAICGKEKR